jgi:Acetyltransferase (GNAT) domain
MEASVPPGLLEGIERDAWIDLYRAAPSGFAAGVGLAATRIGTVTILTMAAVPDTQFNRILGLGVEAPADERTLDAALLRMQEAGNRTFFLHVAPMAEPPMLPDWLGQRGLERYRRPWAKFWHGGELPPTIVSDFAIEEIGAARAGDFAKPVAAGFGAPPAFQAWLAALPGRQGWRTYVAYDAARPVAGAALYCRDEKAWLGVGATDPAHRQRGAHGALMARRIADAVTGGCKLIATETGVALPGEPNPSYANMLRCGFEVAYLRDNWRPAG